MKRFRCDVSVCGFRANPLLIFSRNASTAVVADPYGCLGVSRTVSAADLKAAYRRRALECHPDRHHGDPQAAETFKRVSSAYSVLKDVEQRRLHDQRVQADEERSHRSANATPAYPNMSTTARSHGNNTTNSTKSSGGGFYGVWSSLFNSSSSASSSTYTSSNRQDTYTAPTTEMSHAEAEQLFKKTFFGEHISELPGWNAQRDAVHHPAVPDDDDNIEVKRVRDQDGNEHQFVRKKNNQKSGNAVVDRVFEDDGEEFQNNTPLVVGFTAAPGRGSPNFGNTSVTMGRPRSQAGTGAFGKKPWEGYNGFKF